MRKDSLFPENESDFEPTIPLALAISQSHESSHSSNTMKQTIVGDHAHDLLDKQIQKLVSVKFENNPILLIRQLSRDLAAKEAELILLRQKSAQREHELIRLCTEYGGLSKLEIDQKLACIKKSKDPNEVLSGMIESAIVGDTDRQMKNEDISNLGNRGSHDASGSENITHHDPLNRKLHTSQTLPASSSVSITSSGQLAQRVADPASYKLDQDKFFKEIKSLEDPKNEENHDTKEGRTESSGSENNKWLHWLRPVDTRPSLKSPEPQKNSQNGDSVELSRLNTDIPVGELGIATDPQTDKFGFYHTMRGHSGLSEPDIPVDSVSSKDDIEGDSLSQGLSRSSGVSKFEALGSASQNSTPLQPNVSDIQLDKSMETLKRLGEQHDMKNQELLAHWEDFMARANRRRSSSHSETEGENEKFGFKAHKLRSNKSSSWLSNRTGNLGNSESSMFRELRLLSNEEGIPPKYRNHMWYELSGAHNIHVPGEYLRLLSLCDDSGDPRIESNIEQINLDLHRTLSSNKLFFDISEAKPGPHFYKLRNILYAYIAYNRDVGYSQGMNRIAGNIILGSSDGSRNGSLRLAEEDVFWIFVAVIEDLLPKYGHVLYYDQRALPFIQRDVSITVNQFLPKIMPDLHHHFAKLNVEPAIVVLGWWLGLFTETVKSLELWFSLLDGLMLANDPCVKLITYSLAVMKFLEQSLMALETADKIYLHFQKLKNGTLSNIRILDFASACESIEAHIGASALASMRSED
ncbi:Rab-GTPase-TBC domain-containing protein [Metschnikowia aff. pulcherrima]|uniref:Rab-GTPase-TBC domain-containing protein n=1 Tax=Metschnikowia aff. pulcherrima TaxID=2163413 RepID=A0A4P6XLC7_9ASCO|nr:Rab-GTPase-TBC domain-containing protein [Metschnikowia aff. pulcherrima]